MEKLKKNTKVNGITLIALVITIIVLLILAGISISMLSGDNSILSQAGKAKDSSIISQEKENISLAYNSVITEKMGIGDTSTVTEEEISKAMKSYDEGATITTERSKFVVTYSNGHKYSIYKNGNITEYTTTPYAKDELIVTEKGDTVDSPYYVNYPSAKGTIKCRVLYNDDTYGLQIISSASVMKVRLGKNDPNENVEGEMGSIERAQNSYNRSVTTLNEAAEKYMKTVNESVLATDARCVGSSPILGNKNYPDNLTGEEREAEMFTANTIHTYMNEYNGKLFKSDKNYQVDRIRLKRIGINIFDDSSYGSWYWLASRQAELFSIDYGYCFCPLIQNRKDGNSARWGFIRVDTNGNLTSTDSQYGFRPVFILSPNVKILSGEGTEEVPFEIGT